MIKVWQQLFRKLPSKTKKFKKVNKKINGLISYKRKGININPERLKNPLQKRNNYNTFYNQVFTLEFLMTIFPWLFIFSIYSLKLLILELLLIYCFLAYSIV